MYVVPPSKGSASLDTAKAPTAIKEEEGGGEGGEGALLPPF